MNSQITFVILIVSVAIVSASFLTGTLNTEFLYEQNNEFTQENFELLAKDFRIDSSKAQRFLYDPDGVPNSSDEYFRTTYEGCTFNDIDDAFEICRLAQLKVIEKNEYGSCIGKGPEFEKTYDIGPCDSKIGELVMAVIEP